MPNLIWRLIRTRSRTFGNRYALQYGQWQQAHTRGASKGLQRSFRVEYEEIFTLRQAAEHAFDLRTKGVSHAR